MGKEKEKECKRGGSRRRRTIAGFANMQYLAAAVAIWGPQLLDRLPHGFDNLKTGQGQKWWKNKRVIIVFVALVYCIQSDKLSTRLWSVPLVALFTLSVTQHKLTYGGEAEAESIVEEYK